MPINTDPGWTSGDTDHPNTWDDPNTPGYADPLEAGAAQVFDPNGYADTSATAAMARSGMQGTVDELRKGIGDRQAGYMANAKRQQAANPYNAGMADQTRAAQMALIGQMQQQMNGPSLAGMQGQQALAQGGQQALMQAALGRGGGRAAMMGSAQGAGGLAGSVGQARLGEIMQGQGGMAGVANNLRNSDMVSARQQQQTGLKAQSLADQNARFYGEQGMKLNEASRQALLDNYKLYERERQARLAQAKQTQADTVNTIGTVMKFFI